MRRNSTRWFAAAALLLASATVFAEQNSSGTNAARAAAGDAPYDPAGRRDPFRPPRANSTTAQGEVRTPLQRYDIGQLKLVAVIYNANEPRAVVEDDTGLGYIVRVGTPIGTNGGSIKAIEHGKVRVQEEAIDFYGDRQTSEVVMELANDERGKR
jgi:type IV pilus assembly protein PilP